MEDLTKKSVIEDQQETASTSTFSEKKDAKKPAIDYQHEIPSTSMRDSLIMAFRLNPCDQTLRDLPEAPELYAPDTGPKLYDVKGNNVTPPIIASNLPEIFKYFPIHGKPSSKADLKTFNHNKIREFVGGGLNDEEFSKLAEFCSPKHLKTGEELVMTSSYPGVMPLAATKDDLNTGKDLGDNLCVVKKLKMRNARDTKNLFNRGLKYRGIKLLPPPVETQADLDANKSQLLEPGVDMIFKIRIYRPFHYAVRDRKGNRHSSFQSDLILLGRQTLADLRDKILCTNDASMRTDVSNDLDAVPDTTAKEMFPSGFLFINNVFYVDERPGCKDLSTTVRAWAAQCKRGNFPRHSLNIRLDQLHVRLGHPDVYVHQGTCEHIFTFSEIRLLSASDPLLESSYPMRGAISLNQTVYCTTCAEFGARWLVSSCDQIPFDPAFFCDTCIRMYLYKDGVQVSGFKAYQFRGNELNTKLEKEDL